MVVITNTRCRVALFLITISLLYGCKNKHKDYSHLYIYTKHNRNEVTRLLHYYEQEQDVEKMKIIEYILETLPFQYELKYTIKSSEGHSFLLNKPLSIDSIENLRQKPGYSLQIDTTHLLQTVNADYIINHISVAQLTRSKYSWIKKVHLDDFISFILPYRVNNEPVFDYQAFYGRRYLPYINDVPVKSMDPSTVLKDYLTPFFQMRNYDGVYIDFTSSPNIQPLLDGDDNYPDLEDIAVLHVHALRSIGIPCAYEYAPTLDNYDRGIVIVSAFNGETRSFSNEISRNIYKFRVSKFYRNVFDLRGVKNPFSEINKLGIPIKDIPLALNIPKSVDITSEKTIVQDIEIKIKPKYSHSRVLYLAAGSKDNWKIVAWSEIKIPDNILLFKNMGTNVPYQLVAFKSGITRLIGSPFMIDTIGNRHTLK